MAPWVLRDEQVSFFPAGHSFPTARAPYRRVLILYFVTSVLYPFPVCASSFLLNLISKPVVLPYPGLGSMVSWIKIAATWLVTGLIIAEIAGKALCVLFLPPVRKARFFSFSLTVYLLPRSMIKQVVRNLRSALGPTFPDEALEKIARRYYRELFARPLDLVLGLCLTSADVDRLFLFEGREHLDEALSRGKGVLCISSHYACVALGTLSMGLLGYGGKGSVLVASIPTQPIGFMRRFMAPLARRIERQTGARWVFTGNALIDLLERMGKNEIFCLTLDVPLPLDKHIGVRTRLLGGEVRLHSSLIAQAIDQEAAVVPCFVFPRQGQPGHVIKVWPPIDTDEKGKEGARACLEHCLRIHEDLVRKNPEYWWLWRGFNDFWHPASDQEPSQDPEQLR